MKALTERVSEWVNLNLTSKEHIGDIPRQDLGLNSHLKEGRSMGSNLLPLRWLPFGVQAWFQFDSQFHCSVCFNQWQNKSN